MRLSSIVVKFCVLGVVPSLKNQKIVGRSFKTGRGNLRDDSQVTAYKASFGLQVPAQYRDMKLGSAADLLQCTVTLFHDSWRRDADIAIIPDCLQTAGVVSNDRWIRVFHVYGERIDSGNPRAEIVVSYL